MTKLLMMANGLVTLVDDDVYEWAKSFKWSGGYDADSRYAKRFFQRDGCVVGEYLHRLIMAPPDKMQVDHINGDPLDNRRANLRVVTKSQNAQNLRRPRADSKTGARGVEQQRGRGGYRAVVWVQGRRMYGGTFSTIEEADRAAQGLRRRFMTHAPECAENTP